METVLSRLVDVLAVTGVGVGIVRRGRLAGVGDFVYEVAEPTVGIEMLKVDPLIYSRNRYGGSDLANFSEDYWLPKRAVKTREWATGDCGWDH